MGRPDYNKMFQNQNEYQKDFANYWYTERAKNPKYSDQINAIKLFEDKKYFTQEEAHEVIEFLIRRCYELGATKNY